MSSGFNEASATGEASFHGLVGFLQKPYRYSDLHAAVTNALVS